MATGPCAVEFREAFACFHSQEAKGMECSEKFTAMWACMDQYPEGLKDDEEFLNAEEKKKLVKL